VVKEKSPIPAPRKEFGNTLLVRYSAAARCVKFSEAGRQPELPGDSYLSMSRCTTRVANPRLFSAFLIHSVIITERCLPPVQPNAIVR